MLGRLKDAPELAPVDIEAYAESAGRKFDPEEDEACFDPDPEYMFSQVACLDFFFCVDDALGDPSRLAAKSRSVASSSLFFFFGSP
jgi:hypothetical protein